MLLSIQKIWLLHGHQPTRLLIAMNNVQLRPNHSFFYIVPMMQATELMPFVSLDPLSDFCSFNLKVNELGVSLSQVQATLANTTEILETESAVRMRLEYDIEKLREDHDNLKKEHDDVKTELVKVQVEEPLESKVVPQLGAELDLSLDGWFSSFLCKNDHYW